jgi:hypothetical protein
MKITFMWVNEWKTWKSFWISIFDFNMHLYPKEPSSWYREEYNGVKIPLYVKTYCTRLAGEVKLLGLGFSFNIKHEWTK